MRGGVLAGDAALVLVARHGQRAAAAAQRALQDAQRRRRVQVLLQQHEAAEPGAAQQALRVNRLNLSALCRLHAHAAAQHALLGTQRRCSVQASTVSSTQQRKMLYTHGAQHCNWPIARAADASAADTFLCLRLISVKKLDAQCASLAWYTTTRLGE